MTTPSIHLRNAQGFFSGATGRPAGPGLARRARAALRRLQYARMVQALNGLPDHVLAGIGLSRRDIPERAHLLIYGDE